jgi:MFS family permease
MSGFDSNVDKTDMTSDIAGGSPSPTRKVGTFESLRIRNFRLLLTGSTLSNAGQWIQQIALNWLVYDLTGSGTILGSINLIRSIASLGVIPMAGVLIDRLRRRLLFSIDYSWLFTITLTLGIILITGHIHTSYLFIFAFLGGLVQTVDYSLQQVLVFDLVPRSLTPNAIALVQTGWGLMRSFGPALGGLLIMWLGPGGNFLLQAGIYILIAIAILQIKFPVQKISKHPGSLLDDIKESLRHIINVRVTRSFITLGLIVPLCIIPIFTVLPPIYAVKVFSDESGKILGFLMASVGVGGIAGGVVSASLGYLERRGFLQLGTLFLLSISLIGFAFSTTLWLSLLLLAMAGFFEMIFLTNNQTLIQLSIPDSLRGRVTSIVNLNWSLASLSGLVAGVGSDLLGGPKMITIFLAGIATALIIVFLIFSPTIRNYRLSQAITPDPSNINYDEFK